MSEKTVGASPSSEDAPLRNDGPTLKEWVQAGYKAENYPPQGYAAKEEPVVTTEEPVTNVPPKRFPDEDTPEPGSPFQPAPGRFPAD